MDLSVDCPFFHVQRSVFPIKTSRGRVRSMRSVGNRERRERAGSGWDKRGFGMCLLPGSPQVGAVCFCVAVVIQGTTQPCNPPFS